MSVRRLISSMDKKMFFDSKYMHSKLKTISPFKTKYFPFKTKYSPFVYFPFVSNYFLFMSISPFCLIIHALFASPSPILFTSSLTSSILWLHLAQNVS